MRVVLSFPGTEAALSTRPWYSNVSASLGVAQGMMTEGISWLHADAYDVARIMLDRIWTIML